MRVKSKTKARKSAAKKSGKVTRKFVIDALQPTLDKIFDFPAFQKFLHDRIKVDGQTGNMGSSVILTSRSYGKLEVETRINFSGRYLKYLTKKFLKKHQLRDWLRVVSVAKGVFQLRFFNVAPEQDEDCSE